VAGFEPVGWGFKSLRARFVIDAMGVARLLAYRQGLRVMTLVYRARDPASAELLRGLLEREGIRAIIEGAALSAVVGDVPFTSAFPRILVHDEHAAQARELIATSGLEAGQARTGTGPAWTCASCREPIEGGFTACWKCGADQPPAREKG
jgi:Putative prokaryotic signal transducing protein